MNPSPHRPINPSEAATSLINLGEWIDSRHWCPATGGNFSHRLSSNHALITRSGCHKGALTIADFLKVSIPDGAAITPESENESPHLPIAKPSAETQLHTTIYAHDQSAQVILHTHSVNSTVLSRLTEGDWLTLNGFEMQKALTGNTSHEDNLQVAIVDNDQDMARLASAIKNRWAEHPLSWGFLVRGHGLYSWGDSPAQARQHLEGLEFLFACVLKMRRYE
jgi:methylthioribulose-1-phosphate dehydratase